MRYSRQTDARAQDIESPSNRGIYAFWSGCEPVRLPNVKHQDCDVGRRNTADSTSLTQIARSDARQLLLRLGAELRHRQIVERLGNRDRPHLLLPVDLGLLPANVTRVSGLQDELLRG